MLQTSDEIKSSKVKEVRANDSDSNTFLDLIIIFDVFNQFLKILDNQEI